ncbi:MAG TPA: hypothetical protein VKA05_07625 [Acidimicrobiales bacterium]|nr:hypothetical protein [Acidimicrobiales bacterium]
MANRYRCGACGNLTRFDVVTTRRTRAFHHFSIGGELSVEDTEVLDETIEQVTCRWCGSSKSIERMDESAYESSGSEPRPPADQPESGRADEQDSPGQRFSGSGIGAAR